MTFRKTVQKYLELLSLKRQTFKSLGDLIECFKIVNANNGIEDVTVEKLSAFYESTTLQEILRGKFHYFTLTPLRLTLTQGSTRFAKELLIDRPILLTHSVLASPLSRPPASFSQNGW